MNTFLTAEWRKLAMVNYLADPAQVARWLPRGTEPDLWHGRCYISLVAFMFINTRVNGCRFPFHADFEEVNLRCYVRYNDGGTWKRGVVFIREYVPLPMVSLVANTLFRERYQTVPMQHTWERRQQQLAIAYRWKKNGWHSLQVIAANEPQLIESGSEQEFITQHFWGYSQKAGDTFEYHVQHELWQAYSVADYALQVDFEKCYGPEFSFLDKSAPYSVYLVEGSGIEVFNERKLIIPTEPDTFSGK